MSEIRHTTIDTNSEVQRQIDQQVVERVGKYAVENPSQEQLDALHQEAAADDYKRNQAKEGFSFVSNARDDGRMSGFGGRRAYLARNMMEVHGSENIRIGAAFDVDGKPVPGLHSVYRKKPKNEKSRAA